MIAFLAFLVIFTLSIIIIPVLLTGLGVNLDPWLLNAIAAFIGSLVAIIGSVIINMIIERKKREKIFQRELNMIKIELYNNFILAIHRIVNRKDIKFSTTTFENFIKFASSLDEQRYSKITQEVSVLYFLIKNSEDILYKYSEIYHNVFEIESKKPKNIDDVVEIIEGKNVNKIYEFSILQNIIRLNVNFELAIGIPFEDFDKLISSLDSNISLKEKIHLYIAEQVCKDVFNDDDRIFSIDKFVSGGAQS